MRNLIVLALCLICFGLHGQIRNYANTEVGQSYTEDNQSLSVMPLLQQAERFFKRFDYEEAFFTLETAVAQNPNSAEALLMRAKFKNTTGMPSDAQIDYEMANRLNPYVADLYGYNGADGLYNLLAITTEKGMFRISSELKLNYYHEALDHYILKDKIKESEVDAITKALNALESDQLGIASEIINDLLSSNSYLPLALDLQGLIEYKDGNILDAEIGFNEAKRLDPTFAIASYNLGVIQLDNQEYKKAISHFDRAIKLQPDLSKAYFDRAVAYKSLDEYDLAINDFKTIIDIKGDLYVEAYVNRGLTKKKAGDIGGALLDLNRVVNEFPDNPVLRKTRGDLYLLFGSRALAIEEYSKAISLDINYADAYYNRALAHLQFYDKVSGCEDLERSKDLDNERAEDIQRYFCNY